MPSQTIDQKRRAWITNSKCTRVLAGGGSVLLTVVAAAAVIVATPGNDDPAKRAPQRCTPVPITALEIVPGQGATVTPVAPLSDSWARHVVITRASIHLQADGRTTIELDTCAR